MTGILILAAVIIAAMIAARIITKSATYASTKVCPACKERIKNAATKCRFCGEVFTAKPGMSDEERAGM